jgi:O-methyltransferase
MALVLRKFHEQRVLHLFDSFEGLPEPTELDGAGAISYSDGRSSGKLVPIQKTEASLGEVRGLLIEQLRFSSQQVHFHQGWFQDTVPRDASKIGPIAVLRLDGDWYDSTMTCLKHLYPLVSPGGLVILDDYFCWEGCRKATDEYRATHEISSPLVRIDEAAGYWWKAKPSEF